MGRRKGKRWEKFTKAVDYERCKERVEEAVRHAVQKFRQEHPHEPIFVTYLLLHLKPKRVKPCNI
jgi:hypothetical protein